MSKAEVRAQIDHVIPGSMDDDPPDYSTRRRQVTITLLDGHWAKVSPVVPEYEWFRHKFFLIMPPTPGSYGYEMYFPAGLANWVQAALMLAGYKVSLLDQRSAETSLTLEKGSTARFDAPTRRFVTAIMTIAKVLLRHVPWRKSTYAANC